MPLYDYRCTECDREVEVMHGINESGPEACQHCGGAMRKALSPPAIHFKGSGWAKKDAASARKSKPSTAAKSDASTSSSDATSASGDKGTSDASTKSSSSSDAAKTTTGSTSE